MEQISFESMIYGDVEDINYVEIENECSVVEVLLYCPRIRPKSIDRIVELCSFYCHNEEFRYELLNKGILKCPSMIQRLFKLGKYTIYEIENAILRSKKPYFYLYFKNDFKDISIFDFSNQEEEEFDDNSDEESLSLEEYIYLSYKENSELEKIVKYGFDPSSVEFSMKYDDEKAFERIIAGKSDDCIAEWCPFEWANKPSRMDFLSFSGFFGSIRVFNLLLSSNFVIDETIYENIICSGRMELIHDSLSSLSIKKLINKACEYCHLKVMKFLLDQGGEEHYNIKDVFSFLF